MGADLISPRAARLLADDAALATEYLIIGVWIVLIASELASRAGASALTNLLQSCPPVVLAAPIASLVQFARGGPPGVANWLIHLARGLVAAALSFPVVLLVMWSAAISERITEGVLLLVSAAVLILITRSLVGRRVARRGAWGLILGWLSMALIVQAWLPALGVSATLLLPNISESGMFIALWAPVCALILVALNGRHYSCRPEAESLARIEIL